MKIIGQTKEPQNKRKKTGFKWFLTQRRLRKNTKKIERFKDITLDRIRYGVFSHSRMSGSEEEEFWLIIKSTRGLYPFDVLKTTSRASAIISLKAYFKSKTPKVIQNLYEAVSDKGIFWVSNRCGSNCFFSIEEFLKRIDRSEFIWGWWFNFESIKSPFINPETTKANSSTRKRTRKASSHRDQKLKTKKKRNQRINHSWRNNTPHFLRFTKMTVVQLYPQPKQIEFAETLQSIGFMVERKEVGNPFNAFECSRQALSALCSLTCAS